MFVRGAANRGGAKPAAEPRVVRPAAATLVDFAAAPPPFAIDQARALTWLADIHARAEAARAPLDDHQRAQFADHITRLLAHVACSPEQLAHRGVSVPDLEPDRAKSDVFYDVARRPHGPEVEVRMRRFCELVGSYFGEAYAGEVSPPDDLVHVTCTGYASPSAAQQLVAARRWPTRVCHAYHMGCYAAVPAVRLATGMLATGSRRVDIAHTELCSLQLDPCDHALDQLVVQSLFADGYIRYSVTTAERAAGLAVRALDELIVPESTDAMTWIIGDHGFRMTLARDVPDRIAAALRAFVAHLFAQAGIGIARLGAAVFAVHPGGPKILDRVRAMLELDEAQLATSRAVLRAHGNMSSATLPHIWMRLLADDRVAPGSLVVSLAFGPGLTLCGALLEKR
jgi:predicted naringenin-chalcone synthase